MSPVCHVCADNFLEKKEEIVGAIEKAAFVSFDLEFSGLHFREDYRDVPMDCVSGRISV